MFRYLKNLFVSYKKTPVQQAASREEELARKLKPYERHLFRIYDVITWKEPNLTVLSIIFVNFIFWFISFFNWRFFGCLFTSIFLILLNDAWMNHIWPEIRVPDSSNEGSVDQSERVLPLPELTQYATAVTKQFERIKLLRTTQPTFFCVCSFTFWLFVAGIGSFLPGLFFMYITFMIILTGPGAYIHLLSPEQKQRIRQILNSVCYVIMPPESSKNVDDYIPDSSQENLEILAKAGSNSTDLSTPSSDSSVGDLIPGHDESTVDSIDSFVMTAFEKGDNSETDSEFDSLSFKNTHFNGNSSEEEASLVRDLSFPDIGTVSNQSSTSAFTSALTGAIYKTFPTFSGRLQFKATGEGIMPSPLEEDSDSEFEIIDEDS